MSHSDIPLRAIDHVRFFVGNARQSAYFYRNAFGFDVIAYAGLETKTRHEAGYVLRQGDITFVLASPLSPEHPDSYRIIQHGDGVQDIALEVEDVTAAYRIATERGAIGVRPPTLVEDDFGVYESAVIRAYGDTTHSFVNRDRYRGVFAPGYKPLDPDRYSPRTFHPVGLKAIDHIVGNVEEGKMNEWVRFYERVLGFSQLVSFDDKDISTDYSALMSKVVQGGGGRIKFSINEPAKSRRRSQIEEYLNFYHGPGVQHIALATENIVETVRALRHNDVSFLRVPRAYYEMLPQRVGAIDEDLAELADLGILVDRDDEGYMLQIFTKPVEDRPTLFFEIIERHGSKSFGKGNFKALFEAIERNKRAEERCKLISRGNRAGLIMWHRCPYKLRSGIRQPGLRDNATVDHFRTMMLAGQWDFAGRGHSFVYWRQGNMVWISDGHHRANAALEIGRESGDWSYLHLLLQYGKWEPHLPPPGNPSLFPTRRWWSSWLLWLGW